MVAAAMFSSPAMGANSASPVGISATSTLVLCVPSSSRTERPSQSASGMSCGGGESARHRLKAMKRRSRGRRDGRAIELLGDARRAALREIHVRLRGRRLHGRTGGRGGAHHAAHRHDEVGATQLRTTWATSGVGRVRTVVVCQSTMSVLWRARQKPCSSSVNGPARRALRIDRIGCIDAGVEFLTGCPEAAVDARGRQAGSRWPIRLPQTPGSSP